jgi:hypothetical protein
MHHMRKYKPDDNERVYVDALRVFFLLTASIRACKIIMKIYTHTDSII